MAANKIRSFVANNVLRGNKIINARLKFPILNLRNVSKVYTLRAAAFSIGFLGSFGAAEMLKSGSVFWNRSENKKVSWIDQVVVAALEKEEDDEKADEEVTKTKMSRREKRFNQFASHEYEGQALMTPRDFLESLTENEPKCEIFLNLINTYELFNFALG